MLNKEAKFATFARFWDNSPPTERPANLAPLKRFSFYCVLNLLFKNNSTLKNYIMSRDWIKRAANGQGQVLACSRILVDLEDAAGAGAGTPNANLNFINVVNVGAGASTLTVDGSKSLVGDILIISTIGDSGAYTVNLLGDMAPGQIESDGANATFLVFNGSVFIATVTPSAAP